MSDSAIRCGATPAPPERLQVGQPAQHGVAVDRFAREIVALLKSLYAARSRQLNAKPFGTRGKVIDIPFLDMDVADCPS